MKALDYFTLNADGNYYATSPMGVHYRINERSPGKWSLDNVKWGNLGWNTNPYTHPTPEEAALPYLSVLKCP